MYINKSRAKNNTITKAKSLKSQYYNLLIKLLLISSICVLFVLSGCSNNPKDNRTMYGAGIGAVGGGLIGSAIGGSKGAAIGAAAGGITGAVVGSETYEEKKK